MSGVKYHPLIPWPKIKRYNGMKITISEKMDGTNVGIGIRKKTLVRVQSRNRLISPKDDHRGFAEWLYKNHHEVIKFLGEGDHFGEWCGPGVHDNGVNRHNLSERTLYLFNARKWSRYNSSDFPRNVQVVRRLFTGFAYSGTVDEAMNELGKIGVREKYEPEGIVIYHHGTKIYEKLTYQNVLGKWSSE